MARITVSLIFSFSICIDVLSRSLYSPSAIVFFRFFSSFYLHITLSIELFCASFFFFACWVRVFVCYTLGIDFFFPTFILSSHFLFFFLFLFFFGYLVVSASIGIHLVQYALQQTYLHRVGGGRDFK